MRNIRRLLGLPLLTSTYRALMALIRGAQSRFPCPVCLVPAAELAKLGMEWPIRTPEESKALVTRQESVAQKEEALKAVGLRPVEV